MIIKYNNVEELLKRKCAVCNNTIVLLGIFYFKSNTFNDIQEIDLCCNNRTNHHFFYGKLIKNKVILEKEDISFRDKNIFYCMSINYPDNIVSIRLFDEINKSTTVFNSELRLIINNEVLLNKDYIISRINKFKVLM